MTLSNKLRQLRYAKGWGPDDLASRANISRTALYQIESGKTALPRAATLRRIARALGVGLEQLLPEPGSAVETPGPATVPARAEEIKVQAASENGYHAASHGDTDPLTALPTLRDLDLERKFRLLLCSPLRESIARIIDESYRLVVQDQRHEPL
jgi:transcriptional regulator with XRE-family HTH domain